MDRKGLPQEGLKMIACITMLADHIGAVFFHGSILRLIGRLSFPIYCFLLTEGAVHTRDRKQYGLRLLMGAILAELPFDYLFFGTWNWGKQSVMLTLLIGYLYCTVALAAPGLLQRVLLLLPFAYAGELLRVDYGGWGIVMIGMFLLTKDQPRERLLQTICLLLISRMISRAMVTIGSVQLPMQLFAGAAMVPIGMYDGRKVTNSGWARLGFYLFYPAHLLALYLIGRL